MGSLLCLFVQHKAVGIPDQWSVVCVEEHLIWKLRGDQEKQEISKCLHFAHRTLNFKHFLDLQNATVLLAFS